MDKAYKCFDCDLNFNNRKARWRHINTVHKGLTHSCPFGCGYKSTRKDHLAEHVKIHEHQGTSRDANIGKARKIHVVTMETHNDTGKASAARKASKKRKVEELSEYVPKKKSCFESVPSPKNTGYISRLHSRSLKDHLKIHRVTSIEVQGDVKGFMKGAYDNIKYILDMARCEHGAVKYNLVLLVKFYKATEEDTKCENYFATKQQIALKGYDIQSQLDTTVPYIEARVDSFTKNGSGWVIDYIQFIDISVARYAPFKGSSYLPLPKKLQKKRAIINVKNEDDKCFMWSILAAKHPINSNPTKVSSYKSYEKELNFNGVPFPVDVNDISKFEELNYISINLYQFEADRLYPIYLTPNRSSTDVISLLLLESEGKHHYCWIKDVDMLLNDQSKNGARRHYCAFCLCAFPSKGVLDKHVPLCSSGLQTIEMPDADQKLKFRNVKNQMRSPYVVYADFECLTMKLDTCEPDISRSSTTKVQEHVPCGACAVAVQKCCDDATYQEIVKPEANPDSVRDFLYSLIDYGKQIQDKIDNVVPMKLHAKNWKEHNEVNVCHICGETFDCPTLTETERKKCRDHCHTCGKYRGAAHSKCNLAYRMQRDVEVFIHNSRRYDTHVIMQEVGKVSEKTGAKIECVAKGYEDYLTFALRFKHKLPNGKTVSWRLRFKDSFQFLNAGLDELVKNMDKTAESMQTIHHFFQKECERDLLLRKGVYPYSYMDSWNRFEETELPSKKAFYNDLTNEDITSQDYQHSQHVWKTFNMKNLRDYHNLYLQTDVLLLADVFENFRGVMLKHHGLDPAHYITLPSYTWDACLKYTKVELDLINDADMYAFFEQGIRGGVSMISRRFAKANNIMCPDFDPAKDTSWLMYWDANNLYGWAMNERLPTSGFRWLDDKEIGSLDIEHLPDDAEDGYILEVDLDYPVRLHETHSDYPLAPERMEINDQDLSQYSKHLMKEPRGKVEKLVPNLCPKEKYIVHYRNLKFYIDQGMELLQVHRVVAFKQSTWMASYIAFNTEQRKLAKSDFQKNLFKLLNNQCYGKSMENVRMFLDIHVVASVQRFDKLVARPQYEGSKIFSEDLSAVRLTRKTVKLNKPIYTGFAILDLSKLLMYNFHYKHIVNRYGENASLCFTDTDSLLYIIKTKNIYEDMKNDSHLFDTSDYSRDHPLHSDVNKKAIGKMKDESNGMPIAEFVGLRAKMYSIKMIDGEKEKKRAKGVKKCVVSKKLTHDDYVAALFSGQPQKHVMRHFRTLNHEIHTVVQNKTTLSASDDKRFILDDGIGTLAYGHWRTRFLRGDA